MVEQLAGFPEQIVAIVEESMDAAVVLSQQVPDGVAIMQAAQTAFISGLGAGSLVAAGATAVGMLLALPWWPSHHRALTPSP